MAHPHPAGLLAGFFVGLLVYDKIWHLQANWGDLPTWLLFAIALPGLYQLKVFVQNNAQETKRNIKRDALLDRQRGPSGLHGAGASDGVVDGSRLITRHWASRG